MDSIERHLIELRQALLKQAIDQAKPSEDLLQRAHQSLAGVTVNTGPGNDLVIINSDKTDCSKPDGPPGPPGPLGPVHCCSARLITEDYVVEPTDYYIGVTSEQPVLVLLPPSDGCQEVIIKAEMGPPLGNRKVTVMSSDGSLIDGKASHVIEVPYDYIRLLYRGGNWHLV